MKHETPDLFGTNQYPHVPAEGKTDTSAAAAPAPAVAKEVHRWILRMLLTTTLTADEMAARMAMSILFVRPRVTELKELGHIEDTGERRKNASGKSAKVWRLKR